MSTSIKKNQIDMTTGAIFPKMVAFALPLLLSGVLQLLFNAADVIVVGNFAGDNSLGAVGSTSSFVHLLVNLFNGIAVGANVVAARHFGAKQFSDVKKTVSTTIFLGIIIGVVFGAIGYITSGFAMDMMNSPDGIRDLAVTYLKTYFIGMPGLVVYNFGAALLRAKGDTKRPLYYLIIAGIVNVGLNLLFVIKFNMDVAGVGIATAISYYLSSSLVVITLIKEKDAFKLSKIKFDAEKTINIFKIGLPAGIQGVMFSISNIIIQSAINGFGEIVVAGNSAGQSLEGFVYIAMNAFYQAGMSFTSQNVGAGKYDRIPKILGKASISITVIGIVLGVGTYVLSHPLASIYTSTEEAIYYASIRLLFVCAPQFLCGLMDAVAGVMRGMGHSLCPMLVTMIGVCVMRVAWIFTVFQIPSCHNIQIVYASYPISWIVTIIAHILFYKHFMKKDFHLSLTGKQIADTQK